MSVEPDYSKYFFIDAGSYACSFRSSDPMNPLILQVKDKKTAETNNKTISNLKLPNINNKRIHLLYPYANLRNIPPNLKRGKCTLLPTSVNNPLKLVKIPDGGEDLNKLHVPKEDFPAFFRGLVNIFDGLILLHKNNIAHLDVKPKNIVGKREPDGRYNIRLIDFGFTRDIRNTDYSTFYNNSTPFNYMYWSYDLRVLDKEKYLRFLNYNRRNITVDIRNFGKEITNDNDISPILDLISYLDEAHVMKVLKDDPQNIMKYSDVYALALTLFDIMMRLGFPFTNPSSSRQMMYDLFKQMCSNGGGSIPLENAKEQYIKLVETEFPSAAPSPFMTLRTPYSAYAPPAPPAPVPNVPSCERNSQNAPGCTVVGGNMKNTYKRKLRRKRRNNKTRAKPKRK